MARQSCAVQLANSLWNRSRIRAPDNFSRRIDGLASKDAGRIKLEAFCARQRQHVRIKEGDIPAAIMAARELAGEGFGLAGVRRLEWRESLRSEEHTSELQSHSFISYAVFCLKKK